MPLHAKIRAENVAGLIDESATADAMAQALAIKRHERVNPNQELVGLGLSLVHTNKTLARLRSLKVATWNDGMLSVMDRAGLAAIAMVEPEKEEKRPIL